MHEHHHSHEINGKTEEAALLQYMVSHNASHTKELLKLAEKLKATGKETAATKVLEAVESYEKGNELLELALKESGE